MNPVVWQVAGYKNSGKTTLITSVLPLLKALGLRVAVIKHDIHGFEMDHQGTDTNAFREAGAEGIAITSPVRTAILMEEEQSLSAIINQFGEFDILLVEGFKTASYPKIVMLRDEEDFHLLKHLRSVQAIAADSRSSVYKEMIRAGVKSEEGDYSSIQNGEGSMLPVFDRNQTEDIAAFMLSEYKKGAPSIL